MLTEAQELGTIVLPHTPSLLLWVRTSSDPRHLALYAV
jgi:hypothetical protein